MANTNFQNIFPSFIDREKILNTLWWICLIIEIETKIINKYLNKDILIAFLFQRRRKKEDQSITIVNVWISSMSG